MTGWQWYYLITLVLISSMTGFAARGREWSLVGMQGACVMVVFVCMVIVSNRVCAP
jgi:hypothetical protein